jgi:uncharacterized Zn finger protein
MMPADFGATPWGKAWVRTIESTSTSSPNGLLPKARTLARNSTTVVAVGTGHIEADVSVSRTVFRVRIDLPVWPDQTQTEAGHLIAKATAGHLMTATGDLPDALLADFARHAITIAAPLEEHRSSCTCRARRSPCVHVLATIYALARLVDERPALAVDLRSVSAKTVADPDWVLLSDLDPASFFEGSHDR